MDSTAPAPARLDEEEARRRRTTDCIYFLASPLTCKKGSECEYRHSDAARMNPRDCWYWFHGNCSNPKCSFRHPPLDTLLGAPTTPRAAQQSAPQASASAPAPAPAPAPAQAHGSFPAKQGVPCYYFQKGMCAKGDRCAFLHVPQSVGSGNPSPQQGAAAAARVFTPALQPNPQSKNSWTKPNSSSRQNVPAVGVIDKSKANAHDGNKPPVVQKHNLTASRADHSSRTYQNHGNSYVQSGAPKHYYQPHHQPSVEDDLTENGMEVGEFVREPSAGSGVIVGGVDDDAEQPFKGNHSTYHHRTNGNGITRQTRGGAYESESSYGSSAAERRVSQREHMPAVTAGSSDLRHRLLKQRKLNNNSRSTEPSARHDTHLEDERSDQHHRWRGEQRDGLSRSRLRDRIRLPGEKDTSFDRLGSRSEDWGSRGPPRARQSPPKHSDLRGKLHERLKTRSAEETPGSSAKGSSSGEDAGSLDFAGPKSLAELKAKKGGIGSSSGEDTIVKGVSSSRVTSEIVSSREAATAPFEGPKPLSAILKRKREVVSGSAAAAQHSGSIQEVEAEADDAAGVEEESQILSNDTVGENMEINGEEEEEEEAFHPEDDVAYDDNVDEAAAAQELEEHHQDAEAAAEDYEYEAEGVVAEEDNDYQEYQDEDDDLEDDDDDDDDDFARKVGVMMS